jgi:peptidoglycan-N-acetylglucosamine deacetylase
MQVALTFDAEHPDRPHCPPGNEERVLEVLAREGVRATLFLQGRWVQAHPGVARRVAQEGHLVGNHSHYHVRMRLLSADGFRTDVLNAERAIAETIGADPRPWFRLPFGSGHGDDRLARLLEELGYRNVGWDVDGFDWKENTSARDVEDSIVREALACQSQAIVLMHTWSETTVHALPRIVGRLRQQGASFCTVAELPVAPRATASTPNEGASLEELVGGRGAPGSLGAPPTVVGGLTPPSLMD